MNTSCDGPVNLNSITAHHTHTKFSFAFQLFDFDCDLFMMNVMNVWLPYKIICIRCHLEYPLEIVEITPSVDCVQSVRIYCTALSPTEILKCFHCKNSTKKNQ